MRSFCQVGRGTRKRKGREGRQSGSDRDAVQDIWVGVGFG